MLVGFYFEYVTIERDVTSTFTMKTAVYEFLDTFHPNAILISFKEIK